jgi:proteic killer suppression protein
MIVIKTFADRRTKRLFDTGKAKSLPTEILARALRKLEYINLATRIEDLRVPPGNRLRSLENDRKGFHSISINKQWRICFRFSKGDAYDVEICDYH